MLITFVTSFFHPSYHPTPPANDPNRTVHRAIHARLALPLDGQSSDETDPSGGS
jgi:hypothetical protein